MRKKQSITVITGKRQTTRISDIIRSDAAQTVSAPDTGTDNSGAIPCTPEIPQSNPCQEPPPCYYDDFNRLDGSLGTSSSGDVWGDKYSENPSTYSPVVISDNAMLLANCPDLYYHPDTNTSDIYATSVTFPKQDGITQPKDCIGSPIQMQFTWWADNYFYSNDTIAGGSGTGIIVYGTRKYFGAWRPYEETGESCVEDWIQMSDHGLTFGIGGWVAIRITMGDRTGYQSICNPYHAVANQAYWAVTDRSNGALASASLAPAIPFNFVPNRKYHLKFYRENNSATTTSDGVARVKMWADADPEPDWQKIWIAGDTYEWFVRMGFNAEAMATTEDTTPAVKVYVDDIQFGRACMPTVSTDRLVTMVLERSPQGYYYPPEYSVYGYKAVYFDGVLGRLGVDYDVYQEFVIPHLSIASFSEVVADFYTNPTLVLA